MRSIRVAVLAVVCSAAGLAQSWTFGVKGGIPLTENFDAGSGSYTHASFQSASKTRRYTVGPTVTWNLPFRLGVEVDALYRRLNYDSFDVSIDSANTGATISQWTNATGNRLDVPVLLRWSPRGRVYAVAGPVFGIPFDVKQQIHTTSVSFLQFSDTHTTTGGLTELGKGVNFGAGYDAGVGPIHIKPEIRYSRWISPAFDSYLFLKPTENEVMLLVGFEFGRR